jgi:hypothetical protein
LNYSRLKALWPWLVEAKYAWLSIAVNAIALAVSLRPGTGEPLIRLTGLVLQLFGISTVILGISETRKLFGHPPFARKAKEWLHRFPLLRRDVVIAVSGVSMSACAGKVRAFGTHGPGENPTTEARLAALEKNINALHDRISATQNETDQEFMKAADALKHEEQIRQEADAAIAGRLEATGTGGVHISLIGASWLVVGVILSTAAAEIAVLLK